MKNFFSFVVIGGAVYWIIAKKNHNEKQGLMNLITIKYATYGNPDFDPAFTWSNKDLEKYSVQDLTLILAGTIKPWQS